MNNSNPITEADMLAYLRDVTAYYAPQFLDVINLNAQTASDNSKVILFCYTDTSYNTAIGYGNTYAEAAVDLRAKLGTPASHAAKLREQAAKLMAKADKLEGAK